MKLFLKAILAILLLTATACAGYVKSAPQLISNYPMLRGNDVVLMWQPVPGAVKYRIYQKGELIGEAPASPFTHKAPTEPGEYKWTITGVDANGAEGPHSREGRILLSQRELKGFSFRFIGGILNIRWDEVLLAKIYDIYRAENKEGPYKLIASVTETRYVDIDIKQEEAFFGKTFYYKFQPKAQFEEFFNFDKGILHEVKVEKTLTPPPEPERPNLKVRRSKEAAFIKPRISSCFDAAFLSDGESLVYVDTFARKVAVIDIEGNELRTIGSAGPRPDQYSEPIRLAIDKNDDIYIIDNKKPKIFVYGVDGSFKYSIDTKIIDEKEILEHYKDLILKEPITPKLNAILVHNDRIYATDKITGVIQIYNKTDGSFIDYYKSKDKGEILFFGIVHKMLLGEDGKFYLANPVEREVTVIDFKTDEKYSNVGYASGFTAAFYSINGMAFTNSGDIIATDGVLHSVRVYSKETGYYMYHLGGEKTVRDEKSDFPRPDVNLDFPGPVNVDKNGRIWIYLGRDKGFIVREFIGDDVWDSGSYKSEQ